MQCIRIRIKPAARNHAYSALSSAPLHPRNSASCSLVTTSAYCGSPTRFVFSNKLLSSPSSPACAYSSSPTSSSSNPLSVRPSYFTHRVWRHSHVRMEYPMSPKADELVLVHWLAGSNVVLSAAKQRGYCEKETFLIGGGTAGPRSIGAKEVPSRLYTVSGIVTPCRSRRVEKTSTASTR